MAQNDRKVGLQKQSKADRAWIWWTAVAVFILGTIAFLVIIDVVYAPKAYDPTIHPDAVGK